ncbi:SRPBCC family protein [Fodinibius roseus]|nr:SRPBCC family protein [Fodinibius roseus]
MNTNTEDRKIRLTREFDAPRELVFDAFTAPEKIGQWWGPEGFTTTTREMNFKVGGDWIFTMHGPDGTDYPNHIVYTEIIEPERIIYDHYGHEDEEGDPPHFKTTIVFEDLGERTKINMRMLFPTVEKREEAAEFGAVEGGKQTLGRLAQYLEKKIRKS